MEEIELSGMGVDEEKGGWAPRERLKTRQAYDTDTNENETEKLQIEKGAR